MKIRFLGVEAIQGKKRETGQPYGPFYKLYHAVRVNPVNTANRQVNGHGMVVQEVSISPEVFDQFYKVTPLTEVEVDIQPDPTNFSRTIIAGVKVA